MKAVAALALLALLTPLAAPAAQQPVQKINPDSLIDHPAAPDLSGAWQVEATINADGAPVAAARPLCDFHHADGRLTGACKGPNSQGPASGSVVGRHVTWQWQASAFTATGGNGTVSFKGDLGQDGVIRGTWTFSELPGLTGEFTQQRR